MANSELLISAGLSKQRGKRNLSYEPVCELSHTNMFEYPLAFTVGTLQTEAHLRDLTGAVHHVHVYKYVSAA